MTIHRKIRLDLATPTEVAIRVAHAAVEAMPADVRLTFAGIRLQEALDLVGAYVDDQMRNVSLTAQSEHGCTHLGCPHHGSRTCMNAEHTK